VKVSVLVIVFLLFMACSPHSVEGGSEASSELVSFDWLLGEWKRISESNERVTYEVWTKGEKLKYMGHGFVMEKNDTIWEEYMQLYKADSSWVLRVNTPGNDDLVQFEVTKFSDTSFLAQNELHDFPKRIEYHVTDSILKAVVAADTMAIGFEFEKLK
jgi:hypothetical protein